MICVPHQFKPLLHSLVETFARSATAVSISSKTFESKIIPFIHRRILKPSVPQLSFPI